MTDNIFDGSDTNQNQNQQVVQTTDDPNKVLLEKLNSITNDDGKPKYADLNTAIDALKSSQDYIPTLKQELEKRDAEMAELKAKLDQTSNVEEVVERLLQKQQTNSEDTANQQVTKGLDQDDVAKLVEQKLIENANKAQLQANVDQVAETLTKTYGDNAREEIQKIAKEHGTTPEKLQELAAESPGLVLSLFKQVKQSAPVVDSTVNTQTLQQSNNDELAPPEKSLLSGATSKEQAEYWRKVQADVYKKYGVEQ